MLSEVYDLGPLPKSHERHACVQRAKTELTAKLLEIQTNYDLSPSEMFELLSAEIHRLAARCVAVERRMKDQKGEEDAIQPDSTAEGV